MDHNNTLNKLKDHLIEAKKEKLIIPHKFLFADNGIYDFNSTISFFNWDFHDIHVEIDLTKCVKTNYQAVSIIILYAWKLKSQRCRIVITESENTNGASELFRRLGGRGLFTVFMHENINFKGGKYKPLFAIRNQHDFKTAIEEADSYTNDFNVEFTKTLRYVLSELLYNTLEHGKSYYKFGSSNYKIPSICQFTWYASRNELQFIIADVGIGIKEHLEQSYPAQESHQDAILKAMEPQVSGTFGVTDIYSQKNNAGIGLFLSTNIVRRLNANMHILSGNGVVHISPRDITAKEIENYWPGTLVVVTLKMEKNLKTETLYHMMQEFRESALKEQKRADKIEAEDIFYIEIKNYFGSFAEDKESAIKFRDSKLFPAVRENKRITVNFIGVESAPHSFLSALFASPIKSIGMKAYKQFKFINTNQEIRETVDFILDENTE